MFRPIITDFPEHMTTATLSATLDALPLFFMTQRHFALCLVGSLLLPAIANAATPSDVMAVLTNLPPTLTVSIEAHAGDTTKGSYLAAWVNGTQEVNWQDGTTGKGTWKTTVDLKAQNALNLRIKLDALSDGTNGFFRLTSLDGSYENAALLSKFSLLQKKWITTPLNQEVTSSPLDEIRQGLSGFDDRFNIEDTVTGNGHIYKLTLKPEARAEFLQSLSSSSDAMTNEFASAKDKRIAARKAQLTDGDVSLKVETDSHNALVSAKLYLLIQQGTTYGSIVINATKAAPPSVTATADAITIEEFGSTFGTDLGLPSLPSLMPPSPLAQLSDARNTQRKADVFTILNAVYQYGIDNNGVLPGTIPTLTAQEICPSTTQKTSNSVKDCVDLRTLTDNGTYLIAIPQDPQAPAGHTHYRIILNKENGRITVSAPYAEGGATIDATR